MKQPFIRMECHNDDENAHKFWEYSLGATDVTVAYGRIGGYGRSGTRRVQMKYFAMRAHAMRFIEQKTREKFRKGYVSITFKEDEDSEVEVITASEFNTDFMGRLRGL